MPRKPRPLDRDTGVVRDASLIVIASEDTYAVEDYFVRFQPRRVQFRVLQTENGQSAPKYVVERLDAFRAEFDLKEDDQLWYCGDVDHWASGKHLPNLQRVMQHCAQNGYRVALSNPCFELWLLLHFTDLPENIKIAEEVCGALAAAANGYSKDKGCHSLISEEMVRSAVDRATRLDEGTADIPDTPTTRVYKILELLVQRESIVIKQVQKRSGNDRSQ